MDSTPLVLNVSALAASFLALLTSSFLAVRQARIAHRANHVPVVLEIYRDIRSPQYRESEELLWNTLPGTSPDTPFSQLPEPARSAAFDVCNFYQMLAYLVALRIISYEVAILPVHYRIDRTWAVVRPFVKAERAARGSELSFMNMLEGLAQRVSEQDMGRIVRPMLRNLAT
jgi:hypothetical protein